MRYNSKSVSSDYHTPIEGDVYYNPEVTDQRYYVVHNNELLLLNTGSTIDIRNTESMKYVGHIYNISEAYA